MGADGDELKCEQETIQREIDETTEQLNKALGAIDSATTMEAADAAIKEAKDALHLAQKYKLEAAAADATDAEKKALVKKEAIRKAEEERARRAAELAAAQQAITKALDAVASAETQDAADAAREEAKKAIALAQQYKLEASEAEAAEAERQALAKKEAI